MVINKRWTLTLINLPTVIRFVLAFLVLMSVTQTVSSDYGNGQDGALTVSSANTVVNTYTYLVSTEYSWDNVFTVASSSGFSVNDRILIIQIQNAYEGTQGVYEYRTIESIDGNDLYLDENPQRNYYSGTYNDVSSTVTQVIRIPQYTSVTVNSDASIIAPAWDGTTGGIVAFKSTETVQVDGNISVEGTGFRGGACVQHDCVSAYQAYQGEGYYGMGSASTSGIGTYGGGGGGIHEFCTGSGWGGGGGGGHGTAGETSPGFGSYVGEGGIAYGDDDMYTINFGSGGGGAHSLDTVPTGSAGGGIIIIQANTIQVTGGINANGKTSLGWPDSTGGGAGGSIYLQTNTIVGSNKITANGGAGGYYETPDQKGGAGGDGIIKLEGTLTDQSTAPLLYTLDSGVRRNTLTDATADSLTYNIRAGVYPHVFETGDGRLDMMVVNKPPSITDTNVVFNYSQIKGEVAWAALTLNLSAANATIIFSRTIDFTNTDNLNLDRDVNLTFNYVFVNTTTMTEVNKQATVTLRNLTFQSVKILKNGGSCSDCTVLSYTGGIAVFTVNPDLGAYSAVEIIGWVNWNTIDLARRWVGSSASNNGLIIVGGELQDGTLRRYYSSNASNASLAPKLEVNYTLPDVVMYSNQTLTSAFNLNNYFWDLNSDSLDYQTSPDHPNILLAIQYNGSVDISPINNYYGTQYSMFTASDGMGGETSSNNITINVLAGVTTTTTTTTTTNAPPYVNSITGDDTIILTPGGIIEVKYNATVSDDNGCSDIIWVKGIFWDNQSSGPSTAPNGYSLYMNDSCSRQCTGPTGTASCDFNVLYYANASTEWAINISVYDGPGGDLNYLITPNIEITSQLAINITQDAIPFQKGGSNLNLGDTSDVATYPVQNIGNVGSNLLVSGTNLTCAVGGPIPQTNIKYDRDSVPYGSMCGTLMNNTDNVCDDLDINFNLAKATDSAISTKNTYWGIQIPASGVGGACTGNLTASAAAG